MFGLYYGYIDSKLGAKVKKELFYSSSLPNWQFYDEGFYFYDTLENGVSKMKEVTQSINNFKKPLIHLRRKSNDVDRIL